MEIVALRTAGPWQGYVRFPNVCLLDSIMANEAAGSACVYVRRFAITAVGVPLNLAPRLRRSIRLLWQTNYGNGPAAFWPTEVFGAR